MSIKCLTCAYWEESAENCDKGKCVNGDSSHHGEMMLFDDNCDEWEDNSHGWDK